MSTLAWAKGIQKRNIKLTIQKYLSLGALLLLSVTPLTYVLGNKTLQLASGHPITVPSPQMTQQGRDHLLGSALWTSTRLYRHHLQCQQQ